MGTTHPPEVGAIEAISAMDKTHVNVPRHTARVIQIAPAVPPFAREKTVTTRENSHVRPSTMTYPTIEKNRKRRYERVSEGCLGL